MTTRKRIRVPGGDITGTGGGVTPTGGNVSWGPDFGETGQALEVVTGTPDLTNVELSTQVGLTSALDLTAADLSAQVEVSAVPSLVDLDALATLTPSPAFRYYYLDVPDMLPGDDTWLDQASPDTAHGDDDELRCRRSAPLSNNARTAYIMWNLSEFPDPWTHNGLARITFWAQRSGGLTNAALYYEVHRSTTRPFTEATATWNNTEPAATTELLTSGNTSALSTTITQVTVDVPSSGFNNADGDFLYIKFFGTESTLATQEFIVRSRNYFGTTYEPNFEFSARVGA